MKLMAVQSSYMYLCIGVLVSVRSVRKSKAGAFAVLCRLLRCREKISEEVMCFFRLGYYPGDLVT